MIEAEYGTEAGSCRFIARPNRSLSWRTTVQVYLAILAVSMTVAAVCAAAGAWMVFPFAGLEMLGLGAALYVCALRGLEREVITISEGMVTVDRGRREPEQRHEFPRQWAKAVLKAPRHALHPSRLMITSHGRSVEVGRFLAEDERWELATNLAAILGGRVTPRSPGTERPALFPPRSADAPTVRREQHHD